MVARGVLGGCSSADRGTSPAEDASTTPDVGATDVATPKEGAAGSTDGGEAGSGDADDAGQPMAASAMPRATAGDAECVVFGATGQCILASACVPASEYPSFAGYCPGPADIECCFDIQTPPTPAGYAPMTDAEVTPPMTTWAVAILNDPTTYPMFSTTTMLFGTQLVLARVEWHPPDSNNNVVHRGVTLYVPAD